MVGAQDLPSPECGRLRDGIEPGEIKVSERPVLVIARHRRDGALAECLHAGDGVGAVADEVTETEDPEGALAGGVGEDRRQRFEIAVDVGQDGVADGGP